MGNEKRRTSFTQMCRGFKILKIGALLACGVLLLSACTAQKTPQQNIQTTPEASTQPEFRATNEQDLWRHITHRSTLRARSQRDLFWHIDWFKKNPDYLTRVTKRAQPYLHWVVQEVEKMGLPMEIALLPIVESAYYPFSFSHGTASGLWQFIPSTGKLYGLKQNYWVDERRSIGRSTRAAVAYLKNLNTLFKGDWLLAIAAYNSGPGRVQKAIAKNKRLGKKADFWHIDLPEETKGYVPRLLAVAELIKNPDKYGQTITPIANRAHLGRVYIYSQLDLSLIAQFSGLSLMEIYKLNPDLNRWATPDTPRYELLLPLDKIAQFKKARSQYPREKRLHYQRHQVQSGDSLIKLAKHYNSSVAYIKNINHLSSSRIKIGEKIIIPIAQKPPNYYTLSASRRAKQRLNVKRHGIKTFYTVKKGDSLWHIAQKYQQPVDYIIKWNHLTNAKKALQIGQKLVIWQLQKPKAETLLDIADMGVKIDRKVVYRVKKDDNLSSIALKFHTNVANLKKWNKLNNKALQPGQKLNIIINIINSQTK